MPLGHPAISPGRLFLAWDGIIALSRKHGKIEWQVPVRRYLPQSLLYKHGALFVVEERIVALREKDGHKLWEFSPDANASLGRAAIHGNTLCFGTESHHLYALDIRTGRQLWMADVGPEWKWPATVRGVAIDHRVVYAGVEQWRSENGSTSSGWLIALNARTGKILWRYHTGDGAQRRGISSSPTLTRNLVLAGDYLSNAIVAINRDTGQEVWRFEGKHSFVGFPEAPLVASSVVYAASGDRYVYALDLQAGRPLWRIPMPGSNRAYAMCGKSLLVNYQGLSALDPKTGKVLQTLLQRDDEFPTSDFAVAGRSVFFADATAIYSFTCR